MRKLESSFQQGVVRLLRNAGFYCFAVPNGGSRNYLEAVRLKKEGVLAGVSDLIVLLPNKDVFFIELKNPNGKGRQSQNQFDFEQHVVAFGHKYLIWDDWAQVWKFIQEHGKDVNITGIGGTL